MPKTIFFIADVHNKDEWITTGWNSIPDNIRSNPYMLLVEAVFDEGGENTITENDLDSQILYAKPRNSTDKMTLYAMLRSSRASGGFDSEASIYSVERQIAQKENIKKYVKNNPAINVFVVVVGQAHLEPNSEVRDWIPLQNYNYGTGIAKVLAECPSE